MRIPGRAKNQSCRMPSTTAQRNQRANLFTACPRPSQSLEVFQQVLLPGRVEVRRAVGVPLPAVARLRRVEQEQLAAVGGAGPVGPEADRLGVVLVVAAVER